MTVSEIQAAVPLFRVDFAPADEALAEELLRVERFLGLR